MTLLAAPVVTEEEQQFEVLMISEPLVDNSGAAVIGLSGQSGRALMLGVSRG